MRPEESWPKAAIKSHGFSTWTLQALQEAVSFQAECICINAMKEPSFQVIWGNAVFVCLLTQASAAVRKKCLLPCAETVL